MPEYVLEDAADLERLHMAAKCLNEIHQAEEVAKNAGIFILDRYGSTKEHLAVKIYRDNRIIFCRIIRELGLDLVEAEETRVPRKY